ncbi:Lipopolysaccharide biosynthesis protein-like protein [Methylobacterium sp. GXF4]|nr:Lipopolysaccharide biosynthesis protein-like protein [Methylobacterium sp. GXF4]
MIPQIDTAASVMAANEEQHCDGEVRDRVMHDLSVDAEWYRERYPDVAVAGADPSEHFVLHGRSEGRFPNPETELDTIGEVVDAAWYRARYPDVAATGAEPVRHYLIYGRAEGRYPNADREPRDVWDTRFDPTWYRARNLDLGPYQLNPLEHFRRIGLLEGRAANAAEEDREAWRTSFDPNWYLARNPDVARRGLDPLEHFITEGLIDRRRPNPHVVLESEPVTAAWIERLKGGAFPDEVALFVTHARDGVIKLHVAHHIAILRRCGIVCALIVVCDKADVAVTGEALDQADHAFRRANAGFDFAAWAHVMRLHPELYKAKILYLVNDSVFGPTHPQALERVVARIRASEADLVGLTDNADRGWHIQSYFLALKQRFLTSEAGRAFFDSVVSYAHKNDVVNEYETQLARYATARGFRAEVLFPTPDWLDATLHNWRKLLRAGFPYLKVGTARALVPSVETADWRVEMETRGYDTAPADLTLARLAGQAVGGVSVSSKARHDDERSALVAMHEFLAAGDTVDLSPRASPLVSVLAVLHGRPARLLRLMRALTLGRHAPIDAVIVDNASIDDTHHVIGRLTGATVVTNVAPLPPLRAARQALARARADVVILLRPGERPDVGPSDPPPPADGADGDGRALRDVMERVWPVGELSFEPLAAPAGMPWQAFDLVHQGDRLGTAYAMRRLHAPEALEPLIGFLEPRRADETLDPGVL